MGSHPHERVWSGEPTDDVWSLLEDFSSTVAHELRTPLAVVEGAAETILERRDLLDAEQLDELLRAIRRNSRLANLLLGRLRLARDIEAGEIVLSPEPVDVVELVTETVTDLRPILLQRHPTRVVADEPVEIVADEIAVREIVFNLLSNAAKYSDDGASIEVSVRLDDDGGVEVSVRDHGDGVATKHLERIFGKYERVDPRGHGVGLGLYISRGLARAHGGDIEARQVPDDGTEFVLRLARLPQDSAVDPLRVRL